MPFNLDLYRDLLMTEQIGQRIAYTETTSSTMDDARDLVADEPGIAPGFACVAGQQLSGRGRLGRQWVSDPNLGLYVTFYVKPLVVANATLISLAAALAVAEAALRVSGVQLEFKWPNDVMHHSKKLSGILSEARFNDGDLEVFVGIGINRRPNPVLPPEIASIATSLEEIAGQAPSTEELLAALATALEPRLTQVDEEPSRILADWRAQLATLGQRVTVNLTEGPVTGEASGLGPRGELILTLPDGSRREISAGDVVIPGSTG